MSAVAQLRAVKPVTDEPRNGTVSYRLQRLEQDVEELKRGQPAVMAERVARLSTDVQNLRVEMQTGMSELREKGQTTTRVLMGFLLSFAFFGITLVVSLITYFGA